MQQSEQKTHGYPELLAFGRELLEKAGLSEEKAAAVAEVLAEADLLGHSTHGYQLLPSYLAELEKGGMAKEGEPTEVSDRGGVLVWDGNYLPGPWLVRKALDAILPRARRHGLASVSIRHSHHIACLAAYLEEPSRQGFFSILACNDPSGPLVAPFGGRLGLYTPNPFAAGIPTDGDPVIIDISMSSVSQGTVRRAKTLGRKLPGPWLLDSEGRPSDDPNAFFADPPGTILPLGGMDLGYKGYALGLFIEALSGGLAGHGRKEKASRWGASVFLQLIDPEAYSGKKAFLEEFSPLIESCKANPPRPGFDRVRVPGERALELKAEQLARGVSLFPGILEGLKPWAERYRVSTPGSL